MVYPVLKIFNSKRIDDLKLISGSTINLYLCGPTVYDHVHIGNLRSVIVFDVIHRILLHLGCRVNYVHNLTDVDDKIIQKAQKNKTSEGEITKYYIEAYLQNLTDYNILSPTSTPRATDYIALMQDFVRILLQKKVAYQQGENILFRLDNQFQYGQISKQKIDRLRGGVRQIVQVEKDNPKDFVLWKNTQQGVNWSSPWGEGRPGWHTECAVFIHQLFQAKTIDIHGGGIDLIFPHHENERIQYLAVNKKELSKIWLHVGHLHWKEEKMSKSLKNTLLAKDFFSKYGANVLRYLFLNSHYNQTINLDQQLIQQGLDYIQKIKNFLKRLRFYMFIKKLNLIEEEIKAKDEIIQNLLNNLNTIKILYFLDQITQSLNKMIDQGKQNKDFLISVNDFYFILDILGFKFSLPSYNLETQKLIKKWEGLKKNQQYSEADKIRSQLQEMDII